MNKNFLLLDTHVLLWIIFEPQQFSDKIKELITDAQSKNSLAISSISLWETAMLISKKRIDVYEPIHDFLNSISKINGLNIFEISSEIAAESTLLGIDFHGDPADRIIVATTRVHRSTLLTRDNKILEWAKEGGIRFYKV